MNITSPDSLRLHRQLGKGAYGAVYLASLVADRSRLLAVKIIDLEMEHDMSSVHNETRILAQCQLPQITAYYGLFVLGTRLWICMEYVDGGSVYDLIRAVKLQPDLYSSHTVLGEAQIASILHEVLVALAYLHSHGQIHRDLKSHNILIHSSGSIKLTDFGVSVQLASNFSRRNTTVGTPFWMAPEVISNEGGYSYQADIWLVGCLCYELATSLPPLQNQFRPMVALRKIPKLNSGARDKNGCAVEWTDTIRLDDTGVSLACRDFMAKCFAVDPQSRPSATQLLKHRFVSGMEPDVQLMEMMGRLNMSPGTVGRDTELPLMAETLDDPAPVFDISTLGGGMPTSTDSLVDTEPPAATAASTVPTGSAAGASPLPTVVAPPDPDSYIASMTKVVHRAFNKVDKRVQLSTRQYDALVRLDDAMLGLLQPETAEAGDGMLLQMYLKTLVREASKVEGVRLVAKEKRRDPIERELWRGWMERMKGRWEDGDG